MKLIAPADKVVPYLEWLAAKGRELLLRPMSSEQDRRKALADYAAWSATLAEALARAFEGDEFSSLLDGAPPLGRAGLRSRVRVDLAVLMVAQAYAGPPSATVADVG
jgi:hypothetical protein